MSGALLGILTVPLRPPLGFVDALVGAALGFLVIYLPFIWGYEKLRGFPGMGLGDAKLMLLAGAWFGWKGALFALLAGAVQGTVAVLETRPVLPHSLGAAIGLLGLALVSHAGGQGLLAVALGRLPAGFSSLVIFLEAVAAAILAWILLGEALGPLQVLGGRLILAGIAVARPRRAARTA